MPSKIDQAKEVVARAYNLSDAFEETVEELYNLVDEMVEKKRVKYGEDSEPYKLCHEAATHMREVIKKVQSTHLEGFGLLLDFVKKHAESE